jgi:hypothetical protein
MIPAYSRVVAIDDNEDHLQKIVWGLAKAGFCPIPFHLDDGRLENPPERPLPGIRLVFTDIHMVGGSMTQSTTHASNILNCLKRIISSGPYILVFWSQYPGDSEPIAALIRERAADYGITPPIGFGAIDKNAVFKASETTTNDEFDPDELRELILQSVSKYKTLAVTTSWEDRVARGAARTTNRLFELVSSSAEPEADWEKLLAFLASEAVGKDNAFRAFTNALDAALLPLLEDQLYLIGSEPTLPPDDVAKLVALVGQPLVERPAAVAASNLNSSYLIEEIDSNSTAIRASPASRGMVSKLGASFINSGPFIRAFDCDAKSLLRREFATRELDDADNSQVKLHIVELGPECDHVQGKISTQRYLLAVLVPSELLGAFTGGAKGGKIPSSPKFRNDSILDLGRIFLRGAPGKEWHLLISTRCFMTLPARAIVDSVPQFRLRRALLEEVAHRYVTYTRRPGVMRFKH